MVFLREHQRDGVAFIVRSDQRPELIRLPTLDFSLLEYTTFFEPHKGIIFAHGESHFGACVLLPSLS